MGGYANGMSYTASKGGMISLTYGLARKLAPYGITVNCVAPGTIESDMSRMRDQEAHKKLLEKFPLGRIGTVDEVAFASLYFASIESSFTTGAVLDVNGGLFMG
jgi:3-oxoacyl-[acyl-carrier protein] reductase